MPRRRALQGIAGSLAGIAALGAVAASAEKKDTKGKKNKKGNASTKGRLIQFRVAEKTATIPTSTPTAVTITCPKAKKGQRVYATGGGFESDQGALTMFAITSRPIKNRRGWTVEFINAAAAQNASVSVTCAYFKNK